MLMKHPENATAKSFSPIRRVLKDIFKILFLSQATIIQASAKAIILSFQFHPDLSLLQLYKAKMILKDTKKPTKQK